MPNKRIFVAVPMDKTVSEYAVNALLQVAAHCGKHGYDQILWPCQRVDVARNNIVRMFLQHSTNDDDTLVMLDADHVHPADIVERLVAHNVGVVGALAFTRGAPFKPCFFIYAEGALRTPMEWDRNAGLLPCAVVGTGAIAIQRWAFKKIDELVPETNGFYFQCTYPDSIDIPTPSEDMWFGSTCFHIGIPHHVDTTLVTPHLMVAAVDQEYFEQYKLTNPAETMAVTLTDLGVGQKVGEVVK